MSQFQVKLAATVTAQDMRRVRLIYLPLLGAKTLTLLQLLVDEFALAIRVGERELLLSQEEIARFSGLTEIEVDAALESLDRYRLVERYRREVDGESELLLLLNLSGVRRIQPKGSLHQDLAKRVGLRRADLLLRELLSGEEWPSETAAEVERRGIGVLKVSEAKRDPLVVEEATNRFLNSFKAQLSRITPTPNISTKTYIAQLTKRQPTKAMLETLRLAKESGFTDEALNIICHYAYTQNGRINLPFISTIITNFYRQETLDAAEIRAHLERASTIKRQRMARAEADRRSVALKQPRGEGFLQLALENDPALESKQHDPSPIVTSSPNQASPSLEGDSSEARRREEEKLVKQEMISDILKNLEGD